MLIRASQMNELSEDRAGKFETEMAAHLKRCFPAECARLGEEGLKGFVRYGVERARSYGITASREVCMYIDVMAVFGRNFDRDPQLGWAAAILNDRRWKDAATKTDQLFRAATEHYDQRKSDLA